MKYIPQQNTDDPTNWSFGLLMMKSNETISQSANLCDYDGIHSLTVVYIEYFCFVFVHYAAKEEAQEKQEIWLM